MITILNDIKTKDDFFTPKHHAPVTSTQSVKKGDTVTIRTRLNGDTYLTPVKVKRTTKTRIYVQPLGITVESGAPQEFVETMIDEPKTFTLRKEAAHNGDDEFLESGTKRSKLFHGAFST